MATLCVRRICTRSNPIFRQVCAWESLSATTPAFFHNRARLFKWSMCTAQPIRCYAFKIPHSSNNPEPPVKKTLLQKFKEMYKSYWYVLVPVHLVTSAGWFGGFYYLAKSGVDIVGILESWNVSEKITNSLKDSSMGYFAISYALYKLSTPLRYTVTLGGTTISINYLKEWGYIKPAPSPNELKVMYQERKDNILETIKEKKEFYKDKKDNIIESIRDTKIELKMQKDQSKDSLVKEIKKGLNGIREAKKTQGIIEIEKKQGDS